MELRLTQQETNDLIHDGSVIVERRGIEVCVSFAPHTELGYNIEVVNPYDTVREATK
jgi:hypothetical protein